MGGHTDGPAPPPRLEVVRGARAGLVVPLAGDIVTVGRGAECQLRLDPEGDLQVSGRHAALLRRGVEWVLRDLGSRNGTFLNGAPVQGEAPVRDGDTIALGAEGPLLRFRASAPGPESASGRESSHTALVLGAVIALLVLGASAFLYLDHAGQRRWERERAAMQLRLDTLRLESERAEAALRGAGVTGLASALAGTRGRVERLAGDLARAGARGDRKTATGIRRQVEQAGAVLRRQRAAASLDFAAIQRANRRATAVIYVEYADGTVATATAFAVSPDATMLTNRHAVLGGGARPRRIAIQFSDSEQIFPARLLATADSADLAAVKVEKLVGPVPTVRGLDLRADTLPPGAPVALIGFPLGGDEPKPAADGGAAMVRPILGAGVLRAVSPDRLQVEGYGAEGASGSPIFDAAGDVVGVLFGGRQEAGGQMLYAVPASAAAHLLAVLRSVSSR